MWRRGRRLEGRKRIESLLGERGGEELTLAGGRAEAAVGEGLEGRLRLAGPAQAHAVPRAELVERDAVHLGCVSCFSSLKTWVSMSCSVSRKHASVNPMRWPSWPKSQTLERASPMGAMAWSESCTW